MGKESEPVRKGQRRGQPKGDGNDGSWASAEPNNEGNDDMLDVDLMDVDQTTAVVVAGTIWVNENTDLAVDDVLPGAYDHAAAASSIEINRTGAGFEAVAIFTGVNMVEFARRVNGWEVELDDTDGSYVADEKAKQQAIDWLNENADAISEVWAEHGLEDDTSMEWDGGWLRVRAPLDPSEVTFAGAGDALTSTTALDFAQQGLVEGSDVAAAIIDRVAARAR